MDKFDSFIANIPSRLLRNYVYSGEKDLPRKILNHVYGLKSYLFSKDVQFSISADEFEEKRDFLASLVIAFLEGLGDYTVYKCMLVGITDDGDIKSPANGVFYISKMTRVDFVLMKIKNTLKQSTFKYLGQVEFAN